MDTQKHLCNNCGNFGHLFYNCRKPITSFGIVCYRYKEDNKDKLEYPDISIDDVKESINTINEAVKNDLQEYRLNIHLMNSSNSTKSKNS